MKLCRLFMLDWCWWNFCELITDRKCQKPKYYISAGLTQLASFVSRLATKLSKLHQVNKLFLIFLERDWIGQSASSGQSHMSEPFSRQSFVEVSNADELETQSSCYRREFLKGRKFMRSCLSWEISCCLVNVRNLDM